MRLLSSTFFITLARLAIFLLTFFITPSLARSDATLPPASLKPEILTALDKNGIYIAPEMQHEVDERAITATLQSARTPTRVLFMQQLPKGVQSPWQCAAAIHASFAVRNGLIVVVTERPRNITAYGAGLDKETLQEIASATAKTVDAESYAAGMAQIVRLVDQERATRKASRIRLVFLVIGVGLALAMLLFRCRRRDKKPTF